MVCCDLNKRGSCMGCKPEGVQTISSGYLMLTCGGASNFLPFCHPGRRPEAVVEGPVIIDLAHRVHVLAVATALRCRVGERLPRRHGNGVPWLQAGCAKDVITGPSTAPRRGCAQDDRRAKHEALSPAAKIRARAMRWARHQAAPAGPWAWSRVTDRVPMSARGVAEGISVAVGVAIAAGVGMSAGGHHGRGRLG